MEGKAIKNVKQDVPACVTVRARTHWKLFQGSRPSLVSLSRHVSFEGSLRSRAGDTKIQRACLRGNCHGTEGHLERWGGAGRREKKGFILYGWRQYERKTWKQKDLGPASPASLKDKLRRYSMKYTLSSREGRERSLRIFWTTDSHVPGCNVVTE